MENKDGNNNSGGAIIIVIAILASIIYTICTSSSDSLAETGQIIMFLVSAAIVYWIVKQISKALKSEDESPNSSKSNSNNHSTTNENKGCTTIALAAGGIFALMAIVFNSIGSNYEFNEVIGIVVIIIIGIAIAYYAWRGIKN